MKLIIITLLFINIYSSVYSNTIYYLTKIGLVSPEFLKRNRKYALVIVLIFAAIITPPDVASQIIVAIPVIVLYQISISISKIVTKRQETKK